MSILWSVSQSGGVRSWESISNGAGITYLLLATSIGTGYSHTIRAINENDGSIVWDRDAGWTSYTNSIYFAINNSLGVDFYSGDSSSRPYYQYSSDGVREFFSNKAQIPQNERLSSIQSALGLGPAYTLWEALADNVGNVYVVGGFQVPTSQDGANQYDGFIIKLNKSGFQQWRVDINKGWSDVVSDIAITNTGTLILSGLVQPIKPTNITNNTNAFWAAFSSEGVQKSFNYIETFAGLMTSASTVSDAGDGFIIQYLNYTQNYTTNSSILTKMDDYYDNLSPAISSISLSSIGAVQSFLNADDILSIKINFSENVNVVGNPYIDLYISDVAVKASYSSGSGSNALVFNYVIGAGVNDINGVSVNANSLRLNDGEISDLSGNGAIIDHSTLLDNAAYRVDTDIPDIVIASSSDTLTSGQVLSITFTLSESSRDFSLQDITVTGGVLTNFGGSGAYYSANFSPSSNNFLDTAISVLAGKFSDYAGNQNTNGYFLNFNDVPSGGVTISGSAIQGQTLSVSNTVTDADGLGSISYQWKADGTSISGATASSLTLGQGLVGKAISVTASYTDGQGTAEVVTSSVMSVVANVNDFPGGSVTITGIATQGQTLTASNTLSDADGLG